MRVLVSSFFPTFLSPSRTFLVKRGEEEEKRLAVADLPSFFFSKVFFPFLGKVVFVEGVHFSSFSPTPPPRPPAFYGKWKGVGNPFFSVADGMQKKGSLRLPVFFFFLLFGRRRTFSPGFFLSPRLPRQKTGTSFLFPFF